MARLAAGLPLVFVFALLGVSGCGKKKPPPPPPPPMVVVAHPLQRSIVDWDDYEGRFEAIDTVQVRPRVSGYLTQILFRDGEMVRKGQALFLIDPRPYQAALDQAKAGQARARATLDNAVVEEQRAEKLVAAKAASQQELAARQAAEAQARADLASTKAQVDAAALNLGFTRIVAAVGGRISDRKVSIGNLVTADTTVLTTIVNLNPIRFAFEGAESQYLKYQRLAENGTRASSRMRANPVEIKLQDETEYRWHGHMDFVDNALDNASGTIRGRAVVENPTGLLTPGLFGHMRLLGSHSYTALLLPDSVVSQDQSRQVVLIVGADGKVKQNVVETGPLVDGLRVVRSGVAANDLVIVSGQGRARPGTPVRTTMMQVTPPNNGPPPPAYTLPPSSSAQTAGTR